MIPLKDDNPRTGFPFVNMLFIALNLAIFGMQFFQAPAEAEAFIYKYGAIPVQIVEGVNLQALFTSMFLHGGVMHFLGNMLYLYIFGDNVENLMGSIRYIFFYALCGVGAALSHILMDSSSAIPMVGASGAISGVLGAYMVSYPKARVLVLVPIVFYITTFRIPAIVVLGFWFLTQVTSGFAALGLNAGGGIAWFAHVGGFVVGVILVKIFQRRRPRVLEEYY